MIHVRSFFSPTLPELESAINTYYEKSEVSILLGLSTSWDGANYFALCIEKFVGVPE